MDETVVGAAPARWTTAGMKREDGMQGSPSEAVDERGQSLVMDGGVRVSAPAWWRRTAVDGVAGCSAGDELYGGRSSGELELAGAVLVEARG